MKTTNKLVKGIYGLTILFILFTALAFNVYGQETTAVETEGNINFTGTYPLDQPDPPPPEGIEPEGELPKTYDVDSIFFIILGNALVTAVCLVFLCNRGKEWEKLIVVDCIGKEGNR